MILGLAGRKGCGKSEFAKICQEKGFIIMPMAIALKELTSELVGFDVNSSQESKMKPIELTITDKEIGIIYKKTLIDKQILKDNLLGKIFKCPREILQFVGTDIIRKYNKNWHVDEIKKRINIKNNYCIDDVRFKNECDMIYSLKGDIFFVVRPYFKEVYKHESETSLRWQFFGDKIIINNLPKVQMKKRFEFYLDYVLINNDKFTIPISNCNDYNSLRNKICSLFDSGKNFTEVSKEMNLNEGVLNMYCNNLLIPLEKWDQDAHLFENGELGKLIVKPTGIYNVVKRKHVLLTNNTLALENAKFLL